MGSTKKTIAYRFDSVGNRIGMTDPDGGRFTYAYDAVNRITHLENPQGDRTTYGYDPAGRRSVKKLANGTRVSFTYDAAGNLTTLANLKSDNTVISSFDYAYDRMGNRTSVVEADGSRVTWTYDATYQLTSEHRTGSHAYEDSYSYDPAGNRLLKIHDGARTTSSYDAANQLECSEDASGRTTFTFDEDGNQTGVEKPNGDRTTTSWDFENRTTLVEEASGIRNTMAYEPGGLRVKLEESTGTKKFVWDEQNYLAETDENDDTQVVYTNEPRVYGNLISQYRSTKTHWFYFDAEGSVRTLADSSGTPSGAYTYDCTGQIVADSGTVPITLYWIGHLGYRFDSDVDQYYVRHRTYDPTIARWLAPDPLGIGWRPNLYLYVVNRFGRFVDPSGLFEISPLTAPTAGLADRSNIAPGVVIGVMDWRGTHVTNPIECVTSVYSRVSLGWVVNQCPGLGFGTTAQGGYGVYLEGLYGDPVMHINLTRKHAQHSGWGRRDLRFWEEARRTNRDEGVWWYRIRPFDTLDQWKAYMADSLQTKGTMGVISGVFEYKGFTEAAEEMFNPPRMDHLTIASETQILSFVPNRQRVNYLEMPWLLEAPGIWSTEATDWAIIRVEFLWRYCTEDELVYSYRVSADQEPGEPPDPISGVGAVPTPPPEQ